MLKVYFTLNATIAFLFGLGLIICPSKLLLIYGVELSEAGLVFVRMLGGEFIGFAFLAWFARKMQQSKDLKAILAVFFITFGIGFVVLLIAQLQGVINMFGWSIVSVYLFFSIIYLYHLFRL